MADNVKTLNPGFLESVQPNKREVHQEASIVRASRLSTIYESLEANSGTWSNLDLSLQTNFTTLFNTVKIANRIILRVTVDVVIRFNTNSNGPITVENAIPFDFNAVQFDKIFITTTGTTAIKIIII